MPRRTLLTDAQQTQAAFGAAGSFDTVPPLIAGSVVTSSGGFTPGYVRPGGSYHVYANVADAGVPASGVASVTADMSALSTGQHAVPLSAGEFTAGGASYGYRSAALVADATLPDGQVSYALTAADVAGNSATLNGITVTVDGTAPAGTDVQTANNGLLVGSPEAGDTITFTFSEPIDPYSVVTGWDGSPTPVVVRITDGGLLGSDMLTLRNAANTQQLPLGTVNLGRPGYVTATRDFGASGAASQMVLSGNQVIVTLGTPSGSVGVELVGAHMQWTPTSSLTDRAGNACGTGTVIESGSLDVEF
jgi:hypothetical protein